MVQLFCSFSNSTCCFITWQVSMPVVPLAQSHTHKLTYFPFVMLLAGLEMEASLVDRVVHDNTKFGHIHVLLLYNYGEIEYNNQILCKYF